MTRRAAPLDLSNDYVHRLLAAVGVSCQWLDRASANVLGFVARRLTGSRVGFLGASRPGYESFFAARAGTIGIDDMNRARKSWSRE
jgi:hypothetical protein